MIDALDRTIEQLLRTELNIRSDETEISFNPPDETWSGRRGRSALNLFLYDVRENPTLRRHQWQEMEQREAAGSRRDHVQFKRMPLMLDCFYMVTAWSGADERARPFEEHQLLSRALGALARYPVLNPPMVERPRAEVIAAVNGADANARNLVRVEQLTSGRKFLQAQVEQRAWLDDPKLNPLRSAETEVRTRLANHDVFTNPADVWSSLTVPMRAGFSYVVTLPLDPWDKALQEAHSVGLASFRFSPQPGSGEPPQEFHHLGGCVINAAQSRKPVPDLHVTVMDTALYGGMATVGVFQRRRTDKQGRFGVGGLPAGVYKVLVGPDLDDPLAVADAVVGDIEEQSAAAITHFPLEIVVYIEQAAP